MIRPDLEEDLALIQQLISEAIAAVDAGDLRAAGSLRRLEAEESRLLAEMQATRNEAAIRAYRAEQERTVRKYQERPS